MGALHDNLVSGTIQERKRQIIREVIARDIRANWPAFHQTVRPHLVGMARMVWEHSIFARMDPPYLDLIVPYAHRMYDQRVYEEKIGNALRELLGLRPEELSVWINFRLPHHDETDRKILDLRHAEAIRE